MRPYLTAFLAALTFFQSCAIAGDRHPGFGDFPATAFEGRPAKVRIITAKDRQYASRLRQLAGQLPNFAGHYTLVSWGCGASCIMAAAIDAKNGRVTWLPFTICCWAPSVNKPLEFRLDSRLLVAHGSRNENGEGDYYYQLDASGFQLVKAHAHAEK